MTFVAIGAMIGGIGFLTLDRRDLNMFWLLVTAGIGGGMFIWGLGTYIHYSPAVYELETGEYLHCTPEGGNELRCEVNHR